MSFMKKNILNLIINICVSAGPVHSASWQRLRVESCALREKGLAHGTWANKVSHLRSFLAFTTYYKVPDFPLHRGVLLRFIAFIGRGSLAYKSAANLIGSIKWFASLLDPASPMVFDTVQVSSSLKGLKAQLSRPVRQKLPFTVSHMLKFYNILDLSNMKHLSCWCSMLLAFFGCLRLSNIVPPSMSKFDPLKHLRRSDIRFENNIVLIFYKWSKTNQNASKVSWIPICTVSDERFNVKVYLELLFACVKAPGNAPLLAFDRTQFHTRCTLSNLLDVCVSQAGLSLEDYSWHSFRRGAAMFAFDLGLADSAVQLFGDWSSQAFKNYVEFSFKRKVSVSETIAKNFDHYVNNC